MRLSSLTASEKSFRSVFFNPRGFSLILGDAGHLGSKQEGDSNGVGKTLALKLLHHCLGANGSPPGVADAAGDWWFYLDFVVAGRSHRIARTGDGSKIALDEAEIKLKGLRDWLDGNGGFGDGAYSFRSLFPRFARRTADDCISPTQVAKEQGHEALQRTLYLLGLDDGLAKRKADLKDELDKLKAESSLFTKSTLFREILRAGQRPESRVKELALEVARLRENLLRFEVSEDYRVIETRANELTNELRQLSEESAIREYELDGIREAQAQRIDVTRDDLLSLYSGLQKILKPEVLKRLEDIEDFNNALSTNRLARLSRDEAALSEEVKVLSERARSARQIRESLLQQLHGKRALDEYVTLSLRMAELEEERNRLQAFLDVEREVDRRVQIVRSSMVFQDEVALRYAQSGVIDRHDELYREMVQRLFQDASAGITMRNNSRENKLRFDLDVYVQGQDSDGISDARVLCFDWLAFFHGRQHGLDFIWHDNRLFADLDPKPRASWFSSMLGVYEKTDRQYIASMNHENFESMLTLMNSEEKERALESVVLTLRGDVDRNRLMGFRFN